MISCRFSCRTCGKLYTGKTTDRLRYRWDNHKVDARKAKNGDMENPLFAGSSQRFSGRC